MSEHAERNAARLAVFWSSLVLALSPVAAAVVVAPTRSGPFCPADCVFYPYTDIARLYPHEYLWMYAMLVACFALVVLGAAAVSLTPVVRRPLARIGNGFGLMAATVLAICYFIQIEVIQPSVLAGETDGIAVLTQYNPHGVFSALEDLGYLTLALALFGLTAGLKPLGRLFGLAFWVALAGAVLVVGAFLVITVFYSVARSYYFEVVAILIDWIVMLVAGGLMTVGTMRLTRKSKTWRDVPPIGDR
jgi:hypothetical protein